MPEDVLELGTIGGAQCLGLDKFGSFEIGGAADFAIWDSNDLAGIEDPVGALILGPDRKVKDLFVSGEYTIKDGELVGFDLREAHRNLASRSIRLWN